MKTRILVKLALTGVVLYAALACTLQKCDRGATCASTNAHGPSALPTASPSPTPSATTTPTPVAESCDFDILRLQPVGGMILAIKEESKLSLTPSQTLTCVANDKRIECAGKLEGTKAQHEVSESCNTTTKRLASLAWIVSDPSALYVGTGYEPPIKRLAAGLVSVQASLEGQLSNVVTVR